MSDQQNDDAMQCESVLRDPESVLRKQLGEDLRVESFKTESFGKVGDNYSSTILKVRAVVKKDGRDKEDLMELIAKMLPPTDVQRMIFDIDYTFMKEKFIYEQLIPQYRRVYGEDLDITPGFYGSRLSLRSDADVVDNDAVILMENLQAKGYYMVDRQEGLDHAHLKVAIESLAKFHSIGISIKRNNSEFMSTMQKYMRPVKLVQETARVCLDGVLEILKNNANTKRYYSLVRSTLYKEDINDMHFYPRDVDDPVSTVIHSDLWCNNLLFRKDEAGNVHDAKMVDFQMSYMASPLVDIVFLLFTSMDTLSIERLDEMLELYRVNMLEVLKKLECDTALFEKESFNNRLVFDAGHELLHILLMIKVVHGKDGENIFTCPANELCLRRITWILNIYADKSWFRRGKMWHDDHCKNRHLR